MPLNSRDGVLYAITAYSLWAVAPIYFKWVGHIEPMVILSHRVIWSLVLTSIILLATKRFRALISVIKHPKSMLYLSASTLLIGVNWGVFIWAINDNRLLEVSLGYYINPLMNILLGMIFFAEKLDRVKKVAAALCLAAIAFEIIQFGRLPWVALALALTFAFYGLVRKRLATDSFVGMGVETALLFIPAIWYLLWTTHDYSNPLQNNGITNFQLFMAGPVTMLPLLCFAAAANRISLTALGFFQYIGPSGAFLLAVFVYGEPLTYTKLVTFIIIWAALALLVWQSLRNVPMSRSSKLKT